ncbi:ionotropic receptor 93a-like [Portunus trituberculatus]|uniref:ionotropic receptor 93a-like n=1 Tax=Portunus trituberculatus TaxID=210409 RepID=UPI001E1CF165|nr:ionotropic receptor 93a-like [Portunus trituberculatus]
MIVNLVRREAAGHTSVYAMQNVRIINGLTGLQVNPWGFLLPLTALVWAATLGSLLWVLTILNTLSFLPTNATSRASFCSVRVLLQQDVVWPAQWWWWERLVHGLWMLTVLVLAKSYAGNLMSLLAVRYVPQPFQTLRDVLDHPSVAMIWQKLSSYEQYIRSVKSGVFREVADLEKEGRLKFHTQAQYLTSLDTLVREGDHALVDAAISLRSLIALDFSQKGRCDFYISRDGFMPSLASMWSQKTNPLIHAFNKRIGRLSEQGLITYWMENVPNFTECDNIPKKMLVTSSISASNIWGVFVLLGGGVVAGLAVWCLEVFVKPCKEH